MDLRDNPFHLLGASPRDDRHRILALADDKSLVADAEQERAIAEARATLTNPGKRLAAEVAWLPGLAPERAARLLEMLRDTPWRIPFQPALPTLAALNLLASALREARRFLRILLPEHVADLIAALCTTHAQIKPDAVLDEINAERQVAGFRPVDDVAALAPLLDQRRRHAQHAIDQALALLPAAKRADALTRAVAAATADGTRHGPALLADIVDAYEIGARATLDAAAAVVADLIERARARASKDAASLTLDGLVGELERAVGAWDAIAQPIQLGARSRGIDHDASNALAWEVRSLALTLHNEHGRTDLSQRLTRLLGGAFAEVDAVAERVAEDAAALDGIAARDRAGAELAPLTRQVMASAEGIERAVAAAAPARAVDAEPLLHALARFEDARRRLCDQLGDAAALDGARLDLAFALRQKTVALVNEHGCIDLARAITARLAALFGDLEPIAAYWDEDRTALDRLAQAEAQERGQEMRWRQEIAYEARVGMFRSQLRISADGIDWQGRHWRLQEVAHLRWGGIRRSLNGIPTGTIYRIGFSGGRAGAASIELGNETVYEAFIGRLWKAVGMRLLNQLLVGLRDGHRYDFGATVIDDRGCTLTRRRLFAADQQVRLDWRGVSIGSADGSFVISARNDQHFTAVLSYLEQDDTHILAAGLHLLFDQGAERLSDLLAG